ncbi:hypothetical protein DL96DRAFT_1567394 [Flagelloscypha sp. PMI_526]|nr:hypothetical protein DL96DRAFT_1567394 [Flagelloscypha sp. PMI_526]
MAPPNTKKPATRGSATTDGCAESDTERDEATPAPAKLRRSDLSEDKASASETQSCLGTLVKTDLTRVHPLRFNDIKCYSDFDDRYELGCVIASKHLSETPYSKFAAFEEAKGTPAILDNLALADPTKFRVRSNFIYPSDSDRIARFFLCGFASQRSNTLTNDGDGKTGSGSRCIYFMPSQRGFLRTLEVLSSIFHQNPLYIQSFHAAITISGKREVADKSRQTNRMGGDTRPSPSKRKHQDDPSGLSYPESGVLDPGVDIPIYDGRDVQSFDISSYKHLPRYSGEVTQESALIAVFTVSKFKKGPEKDNKKDFMSFNAQDFILLADDELMQDINDPAGTKELPSFEVLDN